MGCCFSCKKLPKSKNIRIVGLNGLVQEIGYPITVGEVTGKPGNHFLVTQPQLLAAAATPLKVDAPLEAGRVYFLLPTTLFQSPPEELAPIARKLASIARNTPSKSKSKSCSPSPSPSPCNNGGDEVLNKCGKSRSWKPILSTIRERSFNRRSESDLQAQHSNIDTHE